jgi:hypothetical protein
MSLIAVLMNVIGLRDLDEWLLTAARVGLEEEEEEEEERERGFAAVRLRREKSSWKVG